MSVIFSFLLFLFQSFLLCVLLDIFASFVLFFWHPQSLAVTLLFPVLLCSPQLSMPYLCILHLLSYFTELCSCEEEDASQRASQYWIEELVLSKSSSGSDVQEFGINDRMLLHNPYLMMCNSVRTTFVAVVELPEDICGHSLGDEDVAETAWETFHQEYFPAAAVVPSATTGAAPVPLDLESVIDIGENSPLRESTPKKKKNREVHHEQWVGKLASMELSEGVDQLWCNAEKSSEYTYSCSHSPHLILHS